MVSRVLSVFIAAVLLMGCAASKKVDTRSLLPEIDVVQVKENSDEALRVAQEAKLAVDAINTRLTEMDNRMILLSEEVSSVSIAKIEELDQRLSLMLEALKDLQNQVNALKTQPRRAGILSEQATFSPAEASGAITISPEYALYQSALTAFRNKNYVEAEKIFTQVLGQFPNGKYMDNCHYWIGECNYAVGDFAKAISAFKQVLTFSQSSKEDDAQMKLGLSYLKMGQHALAKTEFQKLLDRYPGSEYSQRARDYLNQLK